MVAICSLTVAQEPVAYAAAATPTPIQPISAHVEASVPVPPVDVALAAAEVGTQVGPSLPKASSEPLELVVYRVVAEQEAAALKAATDAEQAKQEALDRFLAAQAKPKPVLVVASSGERVMPTPEQWAQLRHCESTDNYAIDTGNSFYGAYQFTRGTWRTNAPEGWEEVLPSEAPADIQDQAALTLYERRGRQPWPVCGRFLP